ncbi:DUF2804 family protein [Treponema sp.]|uniref:DUF2804 family protein n=1 Tax=Treponema sp. TaxID=166 RepID=UPI003FA21B3C
MNIQKILYTRPITPAPRCPVENSVPLFGSYSGMFHTFDIKGLKKPFGNLPIPSFITDTRITDTIRLLFCDDTIIGEIAFFYGGYFSLMETTLWNRQTNRQLAYRQFLPIGFVHLPKYLAYSVAACRVSGRYVRLFSRLSKGMLYADFDFLASNDRPSCEGRLAFHAEDPQCTDYSAVIPSFVNRRCQAVYFRSFTVHGWVSFGHHQDIQLERNRAVGFIDFRKTYTTLHTKRAVVIGMGYIDGVQVCFHLSKSIAPDSYTYNDNILFYGGKRIPLPPVRITYPFGSSDKWVVQDTENMVDLTFTPNMLLQRNLNILICRRDYKTIYGTFEGSFLIEDDHFLKLKGFPGIAKKVRMRM